MKICYLADVGVGSIHGLRWANYFAKNGHEVHIISLRKPNNDIKDITLHVIKMRDTKIRIVRWIVNSLPILLQTKKLIKKIKPDILHAHCAYDYGVIGALSNFHPFVVTAWGSDILIGPKKSKITKYFTKFALKKADLITCNGENLKEAMIKMGKDSQKINIVYHGVDIGKFNPNQKDKKLKEELRIFDSSMVISTRRLEPIYDVETLIKAIPLVLKQVSDANFIIVNNGSQESHLKELAKSLGVWDSIRFIGWIQHNELPKYLASSDVYISTSLSDGGAVVSTLEAMACGLALVVTDSGDHRKWIRNGENGFVVPTKNSEVLAEKIIYLLKNEEQRKLFGKISRRIIKEKGDYYREMRKMEKLYEGIRGK
jgi:glycosyltransferase involved in cell wall biosynthesis